MEDNPIIYQEEIAPDTVKQLLGVSDLGSDDVTCMLISEYCKTVILVHDNKTGKETEYPLEETHEETLDVKSIETSSKEILGQPAYVTLFTTLAKYLLGIAVLVAVVLCLALLFV